MTILTKQKNIYRAIKIVFKIYFTLKIIHYENYEVLVIKYVYTNGCVGRIS